MLKQLLAVIGSVGLVASWSERYTGPVLARPKAGMTATGAPASASLLLIAAPIPRVPPVPNATRPRRDSAACPDLFSVSVIVMGHSSLGALPLILRR